MRRVLACASLVVLALFVVPTLHAQFAWVENAGQLTLSASDALQIR